MKIAVQLFGHLRTFRETAKKFNQNVVEVNLRLGCEIDVFIHTWNELEARVCTWHSDNQALKGKRLSLLDVEALKSFYPNLKDVQVDDSIDAHGSKISQKNVQRLRESYEEAHEIHYDWIIETRPEILFHNPLRIMDFIGTFKDEQLVANGITAGNCILCGNSNFMRMNIAHPNYICEGDMIYFYKRGVEFEFATKVPINYLFPIDFQFLRYQQCGGKTALNKSKVLTKKLLLQVVAGLIPSKSIRKKIRLL